jgi:hypothetical protein
MSIVSAEKAAPAPPTTAAARRRLGVPAALVPVLSVCALLLVWQVVSARFFRPVLFHDAGHGQAQSAISGRLRADSIVSLRRRGLRARRAPHRGADGSVGFGAADPFIQFGRFVPSRSRRR